MRVQSNGVMRTTNSSRLEMMVPPKPRHRLPVRAVTLAYVV